MTEPPPDVDHRRDPVLAAQVDALGVDVLHLVPRLDRRIDDRVVGLGHDAGVVVERVEAAVAPHRLAHQVGAILLARHVGAHEDGVALPRGPRLAAVSSPAASGDVDGDDPRALLAEHARRHAAHAAPAPVMMQTLSCRRIVPSLLTHGTRPHHKRARGCGATCRNVPATFASCAIEAMELLLLQ